MSFVPRTFEQIRDDMWNVVQSQTQLTDFEIGSVVRSIIEASALEDDEQYFQMVQLLDAFSIQTATGADLDQRVADFNVIRLQPQSSFGQIVIQDLLLIQDTLAFSSVSASLTLLLEDTINFPTGGYPYKVRIGEGNVTVEDVLVTNNNTGTNTLTLQGPGTVNSHSIGERVSYVSGASDKPLSPGIQVQVPAMNGNAPVKVVSSGIGTIVNGNFESTPIDSTAVVPGSAGNIGANQISQFTSSTPFQGAGVRNPFPFAGGRDLESDQALRDRARAQIQALSRGTVLALKQGALGVADSVTGQRVVTSNLIEDFLNEEVILYIDDGTGFTPDTVILARTSLFANPSPNPGAGTIVVVNAANFPQTGFILVSPEDPTQTEVIAFTSVNYSTNTITLAVPTTLIHNIADEVVLVDMLELSAQSGETFLQSQNFPIVRNSQRLWINLGAGFSLSNPVTDYFLNRATGEVQLTSALVAGAQVVMTYTYYTGLVKTVQTVIDGNPNDPVNFPGIRAAGIVVVVETPVIHRVTVRLSISAQPGSNEEDLVPQVQEAIEAYISSLGIGDDVIRAKIIEVSMLITGMFNAIVVTPTSDVIILENELPVPFDTNGNSLVTVT